MKYTNEIEIDLPLEKVIELFDSTENMPKWQPDLISYNHLSGEPGNVGAKSKLTYKMGKREIEMIETITKNQLPKEFSATYEAKGVMNWITNRFEQIEDNKTKWRADNEFQFRGFMKLIGKLMPGSFKKESYKYMKQFKDFAEGAK